MGGCARVASSTALKAITVTCAHAAAKDAFNAQIEEPGSKEETAPSHRQALAAYAHNESEQRMLMCNMERSLSTHPWSCTLLPKRWWFKERDARQPLSILPSAPQEACYPIPAEHSLTNDNSTTISLF